MNKNYVLFINIIIILLHASKKNKNVNYGHSWGEDQLYDFSKYILYELQEIRQLCLVDMSGTTSDDDRQYIIREYKNHLTNVTGKIRDNKSIYNMNKSITEIITIIDYEANNILSIINSEYDSNGIFEKIETMVKLTELTFIIKYYEAQISDYKI
jgi:hypothetical protein